MSQNRRSLVRRRKAHSKRRKSIGRSRLSLSPERLEERTLLAGDLLASGMTPWQNPFLATDVNYDLETTALDALILIQSLNQSGSRSLASADLGQSVAVGDVEGEDAANSQFMDVNGDSYLSPLDVLGVINTINGAEGEGQTITFLHSLTDLQGNALQDRDGDGTPEIIAGEEGIYRIFTRDSRSPRFGVFSSYLNLPWDFGLATPAHTEVQSLAIDPTANGGSFTLQWGAGPGSVSSEIDVGSDYQFNQLTQEWKPQAGLLSVSSSERGAMVQAAVDSISGLAGNVEVTQTAYLTYDIRFTGDLMNANQAELVPQEVAGKELRSGMDVDGIGTDIPGSPPTAVVTVQERIAADPDSNLSFQQAADAAANQAIGAENRTYTFAFQGFLDEAGQTPGLKNIGATARLEQVGQTFEIGWADGWGPGSTHLFYAVRFTADNAGTLTLQVGAPDSNDAFTPDEVTVWPAPQAPQGSELNLFDQRMDEVEFPVALELDIIELATAVDDNVGLNEDSGQTLINVLANDTVVEGTKQISQILTPPSNGVANVTGTVGVDQQISYQPTGDYNGPDQIVYELSDGLGHTDRGTVTITVNPVNDAPVNNVPGAQVMDEDATLVLTGANGISVSDVDSANVQVTLTATSTVSLNDPNYPGITYVVGDGVDDVTVTLQGTLSAVNGALDMLKYDPTSDFNGQGSLTVLSNDLDTGVDSDIIPITINPVNDAPVNTVPTVSPIVEEGSTGNSITGIQVGDVDVGLDNLQVSVSVANGMFSLGGGGGLNFTNGDGTNDRATTFTGPLSAINPALAGLTYSPDTGFIGSDTLAIITNDLGHNGSGGARSDTDSFSIVVEPGARPKANDNDFTVVEDSTGNVLDVLGDDVPSEGPPTGTLSITHINGSQVTGPGTFQTTNGSVAVNSHVSYTPNANFFGTDTFTYTIDDSNGIDPGADITADVTVNVTPVNDGPTIDPPSDLTIDEDNSSTVSLTGISAGPGEDQTLTVTATSSNPGVIPDPSVTYTSPNAGGSLGINPVQDQYGMATVTVTVTDDGNPNLSTQQSFTVTVTPINDAPTISGPNSTIVDEDNPLQISLSITDPDSTAVNASVTFNQGTITTTPDGATYTDGDGLDGSVAFYGTPTQVNNGLSGLTFITSTNYNGPAEVVYNFDDGGPSGTAIHTVTVTVNAVNDLPTAMNDGPLSTEEDTPQTITASALTANDSPGPPNEGGQTLTVTEVSPTTPNGGDVSLVSGIVEYTPGPNFDGTDTFTYKIDDGDPNSTAIGTVTVTVSAVNDPPENRINGSDNFAANGQPTDDNVDLTFSAANGNLLTVTDVDDDGSPTYKVELQITNGTLSLGPNTPAGLATDLSGGNATHWQLNSTASLGDINTALDGVTYHPTTGFIGEAKLTITSNDGGTSGAGIPDPTDTDELTITVAPFNDPPEANDDSVSTPEGTPLDIFVLLNDSAGPNENSFQDIDVSSYDFSNGATGTVQLVDAETGQFRYTPPDDDFNGAVTFTYTIEDDGTVPGPKQDTATVTIDVTQVNDAPTANEDTVTIDPNPNEGDTFTISATTVTGNDTPGPSNESDQQLWVTSVQSQKGATVTVDDKGTPDPSDDTIIYHVPPGFGHSDTVVYEITDNGTTNNANDPLKATGNITVVDAVPADFSGDIFVDLDGDGIQDSIDPGLGGVTVTLSGVDIQGNVVNETATTGSDGSYKFEGVMPAQSGTYLIEAFQPSFFGDGQETVGDQGGQVLGNDDIGVTSNRLGHDGNATGDGNNFGELLTPEKAGDANSLGFATDLLNSQQAGTNPFLDYGLLFGNGWFINIGGWEGYIPGKETAPGSGTYDVTITDSKLWVTDANTKTAYQLDASANPDLLRQNSATRIFGTPQDWGLSQASGQGEGEGGAEGEAIEMLAATGDAGQYAAAVDAAFAEAAAMLG